MAIVKFSQLAVETLRKKYEAEKQEAITNLYPYIVNDPIGIGDHSNIVEEIEKQLEKVAHANDMLTAIDSVDVEFEITRKP